MQKRVFAGVLAALFLLFALVFVGLEAAEADHDCIGERCPVCQLLLTARAASKALAVLSIAAAAVLVFAILSQGLRFGKTEYEKRISPVSLKVKLSD